MNVMRHFLPVRWLMGWRRNGLAFVCGIMATLALPPFFLIELLPLAFTGLYWLLIAAPSRKRMFWDGWWWGWGFYMSGLYWFCIALLTEPDKFAWLIPFTLFGLNAVIAVYCGIICYLLSWVKARGLVRIFIFSVLWTCVEFARGHLFSGFPWNLEGYAFAFSDATLQLASVIGIYGLTWLAVWLGSVWAAFLDPAIKRNYAWAVVISSYLLFIAFTSWGAWRVHEAYQIPEDERYVPGVLLRLVQANIAQPHKWDPKLQMQGLDEHIRLTQLPGIEKVTHIIWPETAVPYAIEPGKPLIRMLGERIPQNKILITGGLRTEGEGDNWQVWNSMVALDHAGDMVGSYDKERLVPFGEFLPSRSLLPKSWLTPVGEHDFSRGHGPQTLQWPGLPVLSPLICYEVIFPEQVAAPDKRPDWMLNVTNDAWFGLSSGPYQHFHMARTRAVEQGIPLIRVANTGISAVIDGVGHVVSSLPMGTQGILDVKLPKPQTDTIYSRYNNYFLLLLIFIALLLTQHQRRRQKN